MQLAQQTARHLQTYPPRPWLHECQCMRFIYVPYAKTQEPAVCDRSAEFTPTLRLVSKRRPRGFSIYLSPRVLALWLPHASWVWSFKSPHARGCQKKKKVVSVQLGVGSRPARRTQHGTLASWRSTSLTSGWTRLWLSRRLLLRRAYVAVFIAW